MKRRVLCILVLLPALLGACGKTVVTPEEQEEKPLETGPVTLTVATCNVLKPSGRCTEMSMDESIVRKALGRSVMGTGADIIGFNELDETLTGSGRYSLSGLCAALRDFSWSLEWPNKIRQNTSLSYSYANGFAYNSAKLKLEESGYVWLSKEEEAWYVKSSSAYLNAGNPERTCIWARFTHKASGKAFWLFVTHLPTDSQGGSYNMAGVVNSFAAQKAGNAPAILTGDMNNAVGSATYRRLAGYWKDGNAEATWGTLSGSSSRYHYTVDVFSGNRPDRRIDHIMTRGCTATDYAPVIVTYTANGQAWCPSDHLPVKATITIE